MTDARWPSRWVTDRRFLRLDAEDLVSYLWALTYSVESGTDGILEDADLMVISRYASSSTEALIKAGLFGRTDDGRILIVDYASTQTTAAEVRAAEDRRIAARLKKRAQRARPRQPAAAGAVDDTGPPGDDARDQPPVAEWVTAPIPASEPF